MAYYAALVSIVQLLKDITHHHPYPHFFLGKHQLHVSLYVKFNHLLEMLDDYSPKDHEDESNDILERRIRDSAYRAQDMIESRISTTLLAHIHLEKRASGVERLHRLWTSTLRHVQDNNWENKYDQDLEKVKTEVDSIVEELKRIKVERNTVHEDLQPNSYISAEASRVQAPSGENTILVFDEDLRTTIKAQLSGESSKLEVISISGMRGLGKTTLARNIFDDRLIHDRFDCRAWVTVSQDYHLKTVLLAIVNSLSISKEGLDGDGEEVLQQHIYKYLFGRRYLIIMDDVWEARFWDDIRRIFPDNSNGSRTMMTTRLSDVADYASSSKFHHQMQFLDEDRSWTLLREKVFAQEHCPEEFAVIGKKIAKNCGGLPLALVVMAGVLSSVKRVKRDWENIAGKVSSTAIDQNDQHLSKILSLSYNHLPHHLKPCFLYLGGYPEDDEIRISKLIRLWVAEGFLKPIEAKSLEEVGEEYFTELVNRNLVLITKKKSNGKFKFCIIHDVLRDLCSQRARDDNFLLSVERNSEFQRAPIGNVRRVYLQFFDDQYPEILKCIEKYGSNVRSLIYCSPEYSFVDESLSAASGCKLLRILDTNAKIPFPFVNEFLNLFPFTSEEIVEPVHSRIPELLHLRYLNLQLHHIPVPSSIFHLQNLQTLIFHSREQLPVEIWKMPQLRHVISKAGVALPQIPHDEVRIADAVPLLGSLQTLSRVVCFRFTCDALEMIPSLKKLGFECSSEGHQIWEDHGLTNLIHLHQLETLYIWFDNPSCYPIPLPKNFAFSSTLIKLTLVRCRLPWKDMSAVGSLPNLEVLKLRRHAFLGEEWEPIEGEFLKLKFLKMDRLRYLKYWRAENTHFPRLEHLCIMRCDALEEIPPGIGDIPTLQLIKLKLLPNDISALESSAREIQQQQLDLGNDDLEVRVIHCFR